MEKGQVVTFVGLDDYSVGLATARYLFKKMNGAGGIIILEGVRGVLTASERLRGFKQALTEFPGIKLLASQPGNYQRLAALTVTENLLQSHPNIAGVLAANDSMALGALEAFDGANRKALAVGINGTKEAWTRSRRVCWRLATATATFRAASGRWRDPLRCGRCPWKLASGRHRSTNYKTMDIPDAAGQPAMGKVVNEPDLGQRPRLGRGFGEMSLTKCTAAIPTGATLAAHHSALRN